LSVIKEKPSHFKKEEGLIDGKYLIL